MNVRRNIRLACAWHLAAEIMRRHATDLGLRVYRTLPMGGQYDCLSFFGSPGIGGNNLIDINLLGRCHVFASPGEPIDYVTALLESEDHLSIADQISERLGCSLPARTPDESVAVRSLRAIASLVGRFCLSPQLVRVHCGLDHDGFDVQTADWLRAHPVAAAALDRLGPSADPSETQRVAGRFWRVVIEDRKIIFDLARGLATEDQRPEVRLADGSFERVMARL